MNGKKMANFALLIVAVAFVLVVAGYYSGKSLATLENRADSTPVSEPVAIKTPPSS